MAAPKGNKFDDCQKLIFNKSLLSDDFRNEKEMTDFINCHASLFARDVLEIEYKSHKREYYLGLPVRLSKGNMPHVDFVFETKGGKLILVECKNVNNTYAELSNSVGQLLSYSCIAKGNGIKIDRLCIVANKFDSRLRMVINEFKLPIEVYVFGKSQVLKLMN